jgi:uncharacterized protein (TIGR03435 family)
VGFDRRSLEVAFVLLTAPFLRASPLIGQQPNQASTPATPPPVFDVVSIRENRSDSGAMNFTPTDDGFTATNITIDFLLPNAYDYRNDQIFGLPKWTDSVHFDIKAKITGHDKDVLKAISREQRRVMFVALLADYFHFRAHVEPRTLPVYDLVIAKNGPRLKQTTRPAGSAVTYPTQFAGFAVTTAGLAAMLTSHTGRTVIDRTGLTGKYDITLKWTPDNAPPVTDGSGDQPPNIFTALQEQLGLKLEPSKGPVDTLVIDHVELPTEN